MSDKANRFKATMEFVPSNWGEGYWNVTVEDTLTGECADSSCHEVNAKQETAERLARDLLGRSKNTVSEKNGTTWSFDVSGEAPENSDEVPG